MSRLQLALNVADLDAAVDFYSRMFAAAPAKRRPGYANFAIAEPPLKLVLIEVGSARDSGVSGALNHLGVEVEDSEDVTAAIDHLASVGFAPVIEENVACCYAVQDKAWVTDPDGAPWEFYTVLADDVDDVDAVELGCSDNGCCTFKVEDDNTSKACC